MPKFHDENQSPTTLLVVLLHLYITHIHFVPTLKVESLTCLEMRAQK